MLRRHGYIFKLETILMCTIWNNTQHKYIVMLFYVVEVLFLL